MGNRRNPTDVSIEDFAFLRRDMERDFIEDDGVICEREAGILIHFDIAVERLRRQRGLERGFELLIKQEGVPTRYTKEMFSEIGISLVPDKPLDAA